jgi:formate dehydrogenase iron-sulfur subunit
MGSYIMSKAFFIDTTLCTACRACQAACKQWHGLPAEETINSGSYQNPDDLSFNTYKLVKMNECMIDGSMRWLFFPAQCRHCLEPPCEYMAGDSSAIYKDSATGAVIFTSVTGKVAGVDDIIGSCPYDVPRKSDKNHLAKCDMCLDRLQNNLLPACVTVCSSGAMNFGDRKTILKQAQERLLVVQNKYPDAMLIDPDEVSTIYLVAFAPSKYSESASAKAGSFDLTRKMAFKKMSRWFFAKAFTG